jgi:dihydrofolate reductase
LNRLPKYVVSRTLASAEWHNSTVIRGDIPKQVAELKRRHEREILIQGSSELIQTLLANELVDEYRILTFPVVLGSGKRLFGSGTEPSAMTLIDTRATSTGVVVNTYRPSGKPSYGSFALDQ